MKSFIPELYKRDIVMISDYVDPLTYSPIEINDEIKFLKMLPKHIGQYGINFKYIEIKNLEELKTELKKLNKDQTVIFNWCDHLDDQEDTDHIVTGVLEDLDFVYTGADTKCLKLVSSKELTKKVLLERGIQTPKYVVAESAQTVSDAQLTYPLIAKLENRHASIGLNLENVVYNSDQLNHIVQKLFNLYDSRVLIEEFVNGQEYTVTVWGNGPAAECIYCTKEIYKNPSVSNIYTETGKFSFGSEEEKNLKSASFNNKKFKKTIDLLCNIAVNSYRALNIYDYGRFDIREKGGKYYVLDCNANPWICIGSQVLKGSKKLGYNYGETIMKICEFALQRNNK